MHCSRLLENYDSKLEARFIIYNSLSIKANNSSLSFCFLRGHWSKHYINIPHFIKTSINYTLFWSFILSSLLTSLLFFLLELKMNCIKERRMDLLCTFFSLTVPSVQLSFYAACLFSFLASHDNFTRTTPWSSI